MTASLRIGTRGSPLALAQAHETRDRLGAAHGALAAAHAIEIVVIQTSGDRFQSGPLTELGGKGLFTKEIEEALLSGSIDIAVHSMKDVPSVLPDGLGIACVLPREHPRDAFLSHAAPSLAALPKGAVVGTASLRRKAILLNRRPDLEVAPIRGNVNTRMRKLAEGEVAATLLAMAGLKRLGKADAATEILAPEDMLPAACQGAIGIECRNSDDATRRLLEPIDDAPSATRVAAERALLAGLDGSCRTPIAALCEFADGGIRLRALIARPDGGGMVETERFGAEADATAMGSDAADELRRRAGPDYFTD
jgi:hydroxymethylbilane synthase